MPSGYNPRPSKIKRFGWANKISAVLSCPEVIEENELVRVHFLWHYSPFGKIVM
jgi:hypothetical protein